MHANSWLDKIRKIWHRERDRKAFYKKWQSLWLQILSHFQYTLFMFTIFFLTEYVHFYFSVSLLRYRYPELSDDSYPTHWNCESWVRVCKGISEEVGRRVHRVQAYQTHGGGSRRGWENEVRTEIWARTLPLLHPLSISDIVVNEQNLFHTVIWIESSYIIYW